MTQPEDRGPKVDLKAVCSCGSSECILLKMNEAMRRRMLEAWKGARP